MLHTATVKRKVSIEVYYKIRNAISLVSIPHGPTFLHWKGDLETNAFASNGITSLVLKYRFFSTKDSITGERKKSYSKYWIIMQINFMKILNKDSLELLKISDVEAIDSTFDLFMQDIEPTFPKFRTFEAQRLDFCRDINTFHVKEYIQLFNMVSLPKAYESGIYQILNSKFKPLSGSFYARPSKSFRKTKVSSKTINFYDKEQERLNHGYSPKIASKYKYNAH